jgi:glucose/arabinose dehydrogenase
VILRLAAVFVLLAACGCSSGSDGSASSLPATSPSVPPASSEPPQPATGVRLVPVARGLDGPVDVVWPPGDPGHMVVVEQPGVAVVFENGHRLAQPLLDLRGKVSTGSEQGLLGLAFAPEFPDDPRIVVNYTDTAGDTNVVTYRLKDWRAETGSARRLLFVDQPYENHNGGDVVFGPDGKLYIGMGDGGSAGDPQNRAQNPDTLLGKMLRLDLDHPRPEIYAGGLRNPWRYSFDRETGDLWIGDVGQNEWEEIDHLPAGTPPGTNFGWNLYEGNHPYRVDGTSGGPFTGPVAEYNHALGCSVTGGFVYRGPSIPVLDGRYVFGDYCSGRLWTLRPGGGSATPMKLQVAGLTTFGEDPDGRLYAASQGGKVYRFAPAG